MSINHFLLTNAILNWDVEGWRLLSFLFLASRLPFGDGKDIVDFSHLSPLACLSVELKHLFQQKMTKKDFSLRGEGDGKDNIFSIPAQHNIYQSKKIWHLFVFSVYLTFLFFVLTNVVLSWDRKDDVDNDGSFLSVIACVKLLKIVNWHSKLVHFLE